MRRSFELPSQLDSQDDREAAGKGSKDEHMDDEREVFEREPCKRLHQAEVVEIGHGAVSAAVAAGAILGCVVLFPAERALVQALVLVAGYPFLGALFYIGYRRRGGWLGAPPQLGPACFAMALASWFLMVSGDPAAQRVAFWFAQTGLVLSGISIGCGLAMIGAALDTDWRGAVRAALEADRAAARRLQAGDGGR
ncbi:MAG: hypothetical protein OXE57_05000 [Alphaproteobacteria bacterium]|nr:hypothetical protein [Alphaproteobacteria bacterium]